MLLLDTNVSVIDRFFPRDKRYGVNRRFVGQLPEVVEQEAFRGPDDNQGSDP